MRDTGPSGSGRWKDYDSISKESYKIFKKDNPKVKITSPQYFKILKTYNKFCMEHLLETGIPFKIPYGLGELRIIKRIKKDGKMFKSVDWPTTNKLWEEDEESKENKTLVYFLNSHTSGYSFTFNWDKKKIVNFSQSSLWALTTSRFLKRSLNKYLKKDTLYQDLYKFQNVGLTSPGKYKEIQKIKSIYGKRK